MSLILPDISNPTINPKRPTIDPKISMTRTFTNRDASAASASAQDEPAMPTETPHTRLDKPTVRPDQKRE
jgi:hypothetical protein